MTHCITLATVIDEEGERLHRIAEGVGRSGRQQAERRESPGTTDLSGVRMERWSDRRVVLTGDAAWCATSMSGIGTTLAIVGGYVLAGELSKSASVPSAFGRYEQLMRPFVKEGQNIPKIVPRMLWPHTASGLALLREAMRVAGTSLVKKAFSNAFARDFKSIDLPVYG